jgi:uncharacterized protein (TIGR02594 family)
MLPKAYQFLDEIGQLPKLVAASLQYLGLKEFPGIENNNPVIMSMAENLGVKNIYTNDDMAWCALYHSYLMKITGKPLPFTGYELIRANSYREWGNKVELSDIKLGDTVVLNRPGGAHVFLAIAVSNATVHGLGGNQSNSVSLGEFDLSRVVAVRRFYATAPPESVKQYFVDRIGNISKNEA